MLRIDGDLVFRDTVKVGHISCNTHGDWFFGMFGSQHLDVTDLEFILTILKARELGA